MLNVNSSNNSKLLCGDAVGNNSGIDGESDDVALTRSSTSFDSLRSEVTKNADDDFNDISSDIKTKIIGSNNGMLEPKKRRKRRNPLDIEIPENLCCEYRGVCWNKSHRSWHSRIEFNGKREHLGYFYTSEEAAKAYDKRAIELFGKNAIVNFPESLHQSSNSKDDVEECAPYYCGKRVQKDGVAQIREVRKKRRTKNSQSKNDEIVKSPLSENKISLHSENNLANSTILQKNSTIIAPNIDISKSISSGLSFQLLSTNNHIRQLVNFNKNYQLGLFKQAPMLPTLSLLPMQKQTLPLSLGTIPRLNAQGNPIFMPYIYHNTFSL